MIDYQNELNPAQFEAVTTGEGPLLVIAGAGSGKTRTIVYRTVYLVDAGVDPESILLLTFTRKASQEMLSRASRLLDDRIAQVSGGTFHSISNFLLRRFGKAVGLAQNYSIMDRSDTVEAIDHIRKALEPGPKDPNASKPPKSRTMAEILSAAVSLGDLDTAMVKRFAHFREFTEVIREIGRRYIEYKYEHSLVDYDDLLSAMVRVLEEHEKIRRHVSDQWRYILVDEYQDTNALQSRLVRLMAYTHDNVMAVGDDSQSIYSFRGANFKNIMDFPHVFPGARIVKLEENYRSTGPILAVTNSIIERASEGFPKRLFTRNTSGPLPLIARPETERDQSRLVVKIIHELQSVGVSLREIAVLVRAGFHSFDLEGELGRNRIPYVKYGGFKFMESAHIKDVLTHLKAAANPKDRVGWIRILQLVEGIGPKTAAKIADMVALSGIPSDIAKFAAKYKKSAERLVELFTTIRDLASHTGSVPEKIERVISYYSDYMTAKYDNYPKRLRDLEQLADMSASYTDLSVFLSELALDPPDEDRSDEWARDNLVLSTIHSAKGLEWHTVIILWAVDGRIPSGKALSSPEEMEEERRLIYVAATRAKHNLVIAAPETSMDRVRGYTPTNLSLFFREAPEEYFRYTDDNRSRW